MNEVKRYHLNLDSDVLECLEDSCKEILEDVFDFGDLAQGCFTVLPSMVDLVFYRTEIEGKLLLLSRFESMNEGLRIS